MIKVKVENNKIEISGHAYFDEAGKDIVCASVSSIVVTTINAIEELTSDVDLDNKILIEVLKEDIVAQKLINNMIFMLEGLEKDYPKNIKILRR